MSPIAKLLAQRLLPEKSRNGGHRSRIICPRCNRLTESRISFLVQAVQMWNSLPFEIYFLKEQSLLARDSST